MIEMLIAVSITSFLGLVLYTTFYQGMKLWDRSVKLVPDFESDILFEKMAYDLRNAYPSTFQPFGGTGSRMEFFSFSRRELIGNSGEVRIKQPVRVRYFFDPESKRILREETDYKRLLQDKKTEEEAQAAPAAEKLRDCKFEYYHENTEKKTYQWKDFWQGGCAPKAIRVSLQYDDQQTIGYLTKVIALPSGGCSV